MTTEKRMETIIAMIKGYEEMSGQSGLVNLVLNDPFTIAKNNYFPFLANAAELIIECKGKFDKETTNASRIAAVKRIATAEKAPHLYGIAAYNGKFYACDGHRLVRMNRDIESIPHIKTPTVQYDKIFDFELSDYTEVELPTVQEVKEAIAKNKALFPAKYGKRGVYQLTKDLFVNPDFLLDMIQALSGSTKTTAYYKNGKTPIYFLNDGIDGILCPVRMADESYILNKRGEEKIA